MTLVKLPNGEEGTLADFIQMIRLDISLFFDAETKEQSRIKSFTGYIWEHKKSVLAAQSEGSELGRDLLQILQTNDRRGPGETYECFWHLLEIMAALDVPHQELIPLLDRKLDDAVAEFERSKHSTVTDEEAVYNGKRDIIAKAASTLNADSSLYSSRALRLSPSSLGLTRINRRWLCGGLSFSMKVSIRTFSKMR